MEVLSKTIQFMVKPQYLAYPAPTLQPLPSPQVKGHPIHEHCELWGSWHSPHCGTPAGHHWWPSPAPQSYEDNQQGSPPITSLDYFLTWACWKVHRLQLMSAPSFPAIGKHMWNIHSRGRIYKVRFPYSSRNSWIHFSLLHQFQWVDVDNTVLLYFAWSIAGATAIFTGGHWYISAVDWYRSSSHGCSYAHAWTHVMCSI